MRSADFATRPGDTLTLGALKPSDTIVPDGPRIAQFLNELLDQSVILPEEWEELDPGSREDIPALHTQAEVLKKLESLHLITHYQAETIRKGCLRDLRLGHYRILGMLGRGGMGVVYRAENTFLRREVAVKVFANSHLSCTKQLRRFYAEARAVARLHHPNLVACLDAGRDEPIDPTAPGRDYFVMEMVNGEDLYSHLRENGPLTLERACDLFQQVAEALVEAHKHGLIHRDLKPSNIMVTPDWQAKLLDFGLAMHPHNRLTEPGTLLGTIGYMAPEQIKDAQAVDSRADIFGLGAVMFAALTAREPFADTGSPLRDLHNRLNNPPPDIKRFRPELPEEFCTLIGRMLSSDPDERPPSARVVAIALAGFRKTGRRPCPDTMQMPREEKRANILLVDDDAPLRRLQKMHLGDEYGVFEAGDGVEMLGILEQQRIDLIVLDVNLPGISGYEMVDTVRKTIPEEKMPMILLTSGMIPAESLGGLLTNGADDFLAKPFARSEFRARIRGLIGRKLNSEVRAVAKETTRVALAGLTRTRPGAPGGPPTPAAPPESWTANLDLLNQVVGQMLNETMSFGPSYAQRMGKYIRALCAGSPDQGDYSRLKDTTFVEMIASAAPLHDLGMIALPHHVIRKPGIIDDHERIIIQTHPVMGAEWIGTVSGQGATLNPHLAVAAEIIRHHHERWDGGGYPDALSGEECPISARVVHVATVYDALRSRRAYRPGLSHSRVIRMMLHEMPGAFDPLLMEALNQIAPKFEKIFSSIEAARS
jgi:response regulator RpfG family c-di-GMP phosphodiesterase/tRNA A-37 threonylcarbamoyl transferase component Bud32